MVGAGGMGGELEGGIGWPASVVLGAMMTSTEAADGLVRLLLLIPRIRCWREGSEVRVGSLPEGKTKAAASPSSATGSVGRNNVSRRAFVFRALTVASRPYEARRALRRVASSTSA